MGWEVCLLVLGRFFPLDKCDKTSNEGGSPRASVLCQSPCSMARRL